MASSLLSEVSSAVSACARGVSRATRRLLCARLSRQDGDHKRQQLEAAADVGGGGQDGEGLWRRAILMGERCEPLNFSGVIHYDSLGRPLPQPRGKAKAGLMLCRSSDAVDEAIAASKKATTKYVAQLQNL